MAPRPIHVFVEHREPLDAPRVLRLFERCGPDRFSWRGPKVPPGERERWVEAARLADWSQAYAWDVAGPGGAPVRVNFALQASAIPMRKLAPASWFHLVVLLPFETAADSAWLASYLDALGAAFTLGFAFADTEHHVRANAEADPAQLAWPIMRLDGKLAQVSDAPFDSRARTLDAWAASLGRRARA